jgi:hypothetical protein
MTKTQKEVYMKYIHTVVIVTALFFLNAAYAGVWYVHPDSAQNCIQDCLDSCSTGDSVLVGSGTYYENITWPNMQGIDLISENGAASTIIDGNGTGRVITIGTGVDTSTVIRGFKLQNGYGGRGGGIRCSNGSCPLITGNIITNNMADSVGGGISCNNASPVIDSNTITENTSLYYGGGIGMGNNSHPTITRNIISDNVTTNQHGAGIMSGGAGGMCSPTITNNTITNNTAGGGGGGLMTVEGQPYIADNEISYNHANNQGGGITCSGSMAMVTNNTISYNTADANGGGMRICNTGAPQIYGNNIHCNSAPTGGGIYCDDQGTAPIIKHNSITACTASSYGAGIHSEDNASPSIDSCSISNNNGDGVSNAISSTLVVNYCNIYGNTGYAVRNLDQYYTLDAENNWWGDPSGPGGVGPGNGDSVSQYVDYEPWLTDSVVWTGIEEFETSKPVTVLLQVSPNPFSKQTTVSFSTGQSVNNVALSIYDATGRLVRSFRPTPYATRSTLIWDGRDDQNRLLPSGAYFIKLHLDNVVEVRKVLLVR